jgi:hypothetical protein
MVLFVLAGAWGWYQRASKPKPLAAQSQPIAAIAAIPTTSTPVAAKSTPSDVNQSSDTPAQTTATHSDRPKATKKAGASGSKSLSNSHSPAKSDLAPGKGPTVESAGAAVADQKPVHVAATSKLNVRIEHPFKSATLSIWVDGRLALTQALEGKQKKRLVVFHGVHGTEEASVSMAAGKHDVKIRVQSEDGYDQTEKISQEFEVNETRVLQVRCNKHEPLLTLALK